MKGIYTKQLFNFGVPLLIGLLHSFFAVKSGWFLFGTEFETPVIITMSFIYNYVCNICYSFQFSITKGL